MPSHSTPQVFLLIALAVPRSLSQRQGTWGGGGGVGLLPTWVAGCSGLFCVLALVRLMLLTLADVFAVLRLDPLLSALAFSCFPIFCERPGGLLLTLGLTGPDACLIRPDFVGRPSTVHIRDQRPCWLN